MGSRRVRDGFETSSDRLETGSRRKTTIFAASFIVVVAAAGAPEAPAAATTTMKEAMITERTPVGMKHWKFHDVPSTIGAASDEAATAAYATHEFRATATTEAEMTVASAASKVARVATAAAG